MEWALLPLKRYADFSGRSRRKEYWLFVLLVSVVSLVLGLVLAMMFGFSAGNAVVAADGSTVVVPTAAGIAGFGTGMIVLLIFLLALFIPSLAVQVRRFHDQNRSGWFALLNLIPYVGGLIVLVFMCLEGTAGPNRFGPDPKGRGDDELARRFE